MTDEAYGLLMGFGRWLTLDEPSNGASPLASLAESLGALAGDLLVLRGDTGGGSFGVNPNYIANTLARDPTGAGTWEEQATWR